MEIITKTASETFDLGRKIGSSLKGGEVLALVGDLGAGKTTFIQGLAKGLRIKNKIASPTFILMRSYNGFKHLDLYRLEGDVQKQVEEFGLFDLIKDAKNIIAIEWAEKIKNELPKETIWIKFTNLEGEQRKIEINN